jgi:hypothetical protein
LPADLSPIQRLAAAALHSQRLVRAPIWLYRHGLGWLFGSRLLMLEHVGRKSGQPRYVVLEVIGHPHPRAWRNLKATMEGALGTDVDRLPIVALDLVSD